jgi:hypothetical protein
MAPLTVSVQFGASWYPRYSPSQVRSASPLRDSLGLRGGPACHGVPYIAARAAKTLTV